ncbi:MAG: FliA/WhiG family RNA polymerase sigma factor [bacterium]
MRGQILLKESAEATAQPNSGAEPSEREKQIQAFLPFIKYQVLRLVGRIPHYVDVQDLTHAGILGLLDALEKFDESRGTQLKTYAEFRIRGAILDELRSMDWATRTTREKIKRLEEAQFKLEGKLKRSPTEEELADFLGLEMGAYHQMLMETKGSGFMSIEDLLEGEPGEQKLNLTSEADPYESLSNRQLRSKVLDGLKHLNEKEQLVLQLYYYEELTMKEIGMILDVTESRVCQIHSAALKKLRACLEKKI